MKEVEIFDDEGSVDIGIIEEYEKIYNVKFPYNYKILLSKHNGLWPERKVFKFYDEVVEEWVEDEIYFYPFNNENLYNWCDLIMEKHIDDEIFPQYVIPFGGAANGDYICFDYRDNPKSDNPKIMLFHHDAINDDDTLVTSFLSNSFEEFMDSLYVYKDEEEEENNN